MKQNNTFWQGLNRQPNELKLGDIVIDERGIPIAISEHSIDEIKELASSGHFKEFIPVEARKAFPNFDKNNH
ncbi:hypothetical protein [Paenisporosarcina cavernae]|uniref:Uncharacterized protein n=1 Tax=Paenisporosarcina cavernae TaxID=2320858 RepID=A0A385YQ13_9BACL|nr:hypothetical protein [Paenisporosarcina cavernae]AYC28706.1 hypothetical protein D3873_02025 [Paenisporosarcina cavernae]